MSEAARKILLALAAVSLLTGATPAIGERGEPRVAVIVDTSGSMAYPGMDPQRRSLLVTRLLSDLVPGDLAVVRLLDLVADADLLPKVPTGMTQPCTEDPSQICTVFAPASDWNADARRGQFGLISRPRRGDPGFKQELIRHLEQRSNNSPFSLAFSSAQGYLEQGDAADERTILWLFDGASDDPAGLRDVVSRLVEDGVRVEALVFGSGQTALAESTGAEVYAVDDAGELMGAFADAFRRIVGAPYRIDRLVDAQPRFEMQSNVDEAWVVVYGDDSLRGAIVSGPGGTDLEANHAADQWPGAGSYRVAHLTEPQAGTWRVIADGGGEATAYAVIQLSELAPKLLSPEQASAGQEIDVVASVTARDGQPINDPEVVADSRITAVLNGRTYDLVDDGTGADEVAGDGRFTARVVLEATDGDAPVTLRLVSPVAVREIETTIHVRGRFEYDGGPVVVDLGELRAGESVCQSLSFVADHVGSFQFELRPRREPPSGHQLELRLPAGPLTVGGAPRAIAPGEPIEVCLVTGRNAGSSRGGGQPWLELAPVGLPAAVPVVLSWQVQALTFWERWGRLILILLALLILIGVILGFVLPQRFKPTHAVVYVQDLEDLEDGSPMPITRWRGVGIGFYRNAKAYLQPDYRLSGRKAGALAALHAERGGFQVLPGSGGSLHRRTADGDWEPVSEEGRRGRSGDVYRVGDRGPYFRLSTRLGR